MPKIKTNDVMVKAALRAWFENTAKGWEPAMYAAITAALEARRQ